MRQMGKKQASSKKICACIQGFIIVLLVCTYPRLKASTRTSKNDKCEQCEKDQVKIVSYHKLLLIIASNVKNIDSAFKLDTVQFFILTFAVNKFFKIAQN